MVGCSTEIRTTLLLPLATSAPGRHTPPTPQAVTDIRPERLGVDVVRGHTGPARTGLADATSPAGLLAVAPSALAATQLRWRSRNLIGSTPRSSTPVGCWDPARSTDPQTRASDRKVTRITESLPRIWVCRVLTYGLGPWNQCLVAMRCACSG